MLEPSRADDLYWESMHNPAAGELGITTQRELEDFVENALPKFKLVTPKGAHNRRDIVVGINGSHDTRALAWAQSALVRRYTS